MKTKREMDRQETISQLFEAHHEGDPLRIESAIRHLEFLDTLDKFTVYEERH